MKAIVAVLCVLGVLGSHPTLATPFVMTLQAVRTTCSNGDFIISKDVRVGTDGPVPTLNSKYDIVKDLPKDVQCGTEFFKKEGDEYNKLPFAMDPSDCCNILTTEKYKEAMEKQNVPKDCPIKAGSYELKNFIVDTEPMSDDIQRGEFRAAFKMTLPSGDCLYGEETDWKVTDK
ncbi:uncharacterized protein LOC111867630 [Cryptotermes secundus]|uniref:uncharacterized protein LOC111867630 n=1 Tax=Cryptotermes secundus TaxID=105785 RepID=UPI000CD7D736|nr:uncharacterized protein LOC111867630 [Cryptotermes secundus]